MSNLRYYSVLVCIVCVTFASDQPVFQLTSENVDATLAKSPLTFVNFYADWCFFSQRLMPIWESLAKKAAEKFGASVLIAKVDSEASKDVAARFGVSKYPTMKVFRYDRMMKHEYRGARSEEALIEFLEKLMVNPIEIVNSTHELKETTTGQVFGHFSSSESLAYKHYIEVALVLKDQCKFFASFSGADGSTDGTVFVLPAASSESVQMPATISLANTNLAIDWTQRHCVALVREITFDNAEELTEEGNPFLILFHDPSDKETPKRFTNFVHENLFMESSSVTFLTADGLRFAHPLKHLGKSKSDLPLIAIDSFRHMYLFPDGVEFDEPGRLKKFIDDNNSGELHRAFHYGSSTQPNSGQSPTTPPDSVFQKLSPSSNRYSLPRDEL